MESYDERRRREEERRQGRQEDSGRHRDTWWHRGGQDEDRSQRSEERSRFSPDWSREGAEPRYSDDPYYSRNREQGSGEYSRSERSGGGPSDDRRLWEQRARGGEEEGSHYRGYYSRSAEPFSYPGGQGYVFSESLTLHGPYTGRGPKGYKRSDEKIIEEASQRLERDGEIDASEIEVTAEDGVIRLRGTVDDRQTKRRAEACVESIYGVRDVMNELRVSQRGTQQRQGSQGTQASQGASTPGMRQGEQPEDDKLSQRH